MSGLKTRTSALEAFRFALDQLAESFLLTDRDGLIVHINPQFEAVTGYQRDEVIGLTPRILKSGVHPPEVYKQLWETLHQGNPFRFIFTNKKKSGELYEEGVLISPIRDENGDISHFVSLGRVIDQFRQTYDVYTLLANNSPIGMYVLQAGRFFFVNTEFQEMTGYAAEELIGKERLLLVLPEDRQLVENALPPLSGADSLSGPFEYRLLDKAGNIKWVLETIRAAEFRGLAAVAGGFLTSSVIDITDRKQAELRLKEALSLYSTTIESTTDGILVCDLTGEIVAHNTRFLEMWHLSAKGSVTVRASDAYPIIQNHLEDPDSAQDLTGSTPSSAEGEILGRLELKDGRTYELYSAPQIVEGVTTGRVWSFRDATERNRLEATLTRLASHDSLTGLLNRRRFQEEVNLAISQGGTGAVLFMDIDDFKAINDSLGHSAGDEFLKSLARCLGAGLRQADVLARLGGDEFAVLLTRTDRQEALRVAKRLLDAAQQLRVLASERTISCTLSIGVALYPAHGTSLDELLGHADMAMYRVKQAGRNNLYVFQPRLASKTSGTSRVFWKQKIVEAIGNNRFILYAQPIYHLSTGKIARHELLLRLREQRGTLAPPRRFFRIAEESGLINQIDSWVTEQALGLAAEAAASSACKYLSFNLSARALSNDELLEQIKRQVDEFQVDPSRICVEITETALISDLVEAQHFLRSLKALGFKVALDDFGAGFSSFSRLKNLPIDFLKIDGSFIKELPRSLADQHFVKAIATVVAGLGIEAIAEFVGDAETVQLLREFSVAYGQGYFLGRPAPASRLTPLSRAAA